MVEIEKETGTEQQNADAGWMKEIKNHRDSEAKGMDTLNEQRLTIQENLQAEIAIENKKLAEIKKSIAPRRRIADDLVVPMHDEMETCSIEWMELDIERETNEEEQINIKRLNSLLRFLALGDTPVCEEMSGEDEPCNAKRDHGQCTWSTRGTSEGGNGEAAEGEKTFCACEWGYYGENCEKVQCPGFGKVLYKDTDPGVCSDRGGSCDNTQCDDNGCDSDKGVCAKCHHKYHGYGAKVNKCRGSVNGGGSSVEAKFAGWSPSACNNRGECK